MDQEYINLVEPGYFVFDNNGMGCFVFGTVVGFIDCRFEKEKDGEKVDYSWDGTSETDPACGRGWFKITETGQLHGRIFIHDGDDSWVKMERH